MNREENFASEGKKNCNPSRGMSQLTLRIQGIVVCTKYGFPNVLLVSPLGVGASNSDIPNDTFGSTDQLRASAQHGGWHPVVPALCESLLTALQLVADQLGHRFFHHPAISPNARWPLLYVAVTFPFGRPLGIMSCAPHLGSPRYRAKKGYICLDISTS